MYRHGPPARPITMQLDPGQPVPLPRPMTHVGSLRTERSFGVSFPNEGFEPASKADSMPSPEGGLAAKDALILGLSRLQPENPGQKDRQSALLGQLAGILEEVAELVTEVSNDRHTRLTIEHRKIRIQGRKAEERLKRASESFIAKDVFCLNMLSAQEQARMNLEHLHDQEQRGEHLKRFHNDKEEREWRERYSEYQDLLKAAAAMAEEAVRDRAEAQEELSAAQEEVNRLAGSESRIRAELKGTQYWDPELGLGEPGQGVLTSDIIRTMRPID